MTTSLDRAADLVSAAVAETAEHRALIEPPNGMLMLVYGLGDDPAFDLLRWLAHNADTTLRTLDERHDTDFLACVRRGIAVTVGVRHGADVRLRADRGG